MPPPRPAHPRATCSSPEPVHLEAGVLERRARLRGRWPSCPGFLGRTVDGVTSLLGRGGSDYTAVFLADRLGADALPADQGHGRPLRSRSRPARGRPPLRGAVLGRRPPPRRRGRAASRRALRARAPARLRGRRLARGAGDAWSVRDPRASLSPPRAPRARRASASSASAPSASAYTALLEACTATVRGRGHRGAGPRAACRRGARAALLTTDARAVVDAAEVVVEAIVGRGAGGLAGAGGPSSAGTSGGLGQQGAGRRARSRAGPPGRASWRRAPLLGRGGRSGPRAGDRCPAGRTGRLRPRSKAC